MGKFKPGDKVYILESNRSVREAEVVSCGSFYTVKFHSYNGVAAIRVRESRLFATREEAEARKPEITKR